MKLHSFLYQRPCSKDSKSNSWYNSATDEQLIAPIITKQVLYWKDSNFLEDDAL